MSSRANLFSMLVIIALTGATLLVTQHKVKAAYEKKLEAQFQNEVAYFEQLQESRVEPMRESGLRFARSAPVIAAITKYRHEPTEETIKQLYHYLCDELETRKLESAAGILLDHQHSVIVRGDYKCTALTNLYSYLAQIKSSRVEPQQQTGYLPALLDNTNQIFEVVLTKIIDPTTNEMLGEVVLGSPMPELGGQAESSTKLGIFLDGAIYSARLSSEARQKIMDQFKYFEDGPDQFCFLISVEGRTESVWFRLLNPNSDFPRAYLVSVYSLEESLRAQGQLGRRILAFGGIALVATLAIRMFR